MAESASALRGAPDRSLSPAGRVRSIQERGRRESLAIAFFGSWTIFGLYVDGWAHQADKPETFFTPWHGLLYSGFVAAVIWFALDGRRSRYEMAATDRLATGGLIVFVTGAVGDGIWHEVFGVEVDLEALLSPTHLLLMTGGLLMLSAPVRWALGPSTDLPSAPLLRSFAPVAVALTLCASLATFFTMYLGANEPIARTGSELGEVAGVASVLARTLLVMAPLLLARRRWTLPLGTCTILLGVNALAMAALEGFRFPELILPFVIGGAAGDLLVRRSSAAAFAIAVPLTTWAAYFAVHEVVFGMTWTVELWSGAIFLATAASYGLASLIAAGSGATE